MLWSRDVHSRRLVLAGGAAAVVAVAAVIAQLGSLPVVGIVFGVIAVYLLVQSRSRVVVDDAGVRVEQALLRRTLTAAPIAEIVEARAIRLDPERLALSGYGVITSPQISGFRARTDGEALELVLTGDRRFVVTVGDAAGAAAAVTAELTRRGGPATG